MKSFLLDTCALLWLAQGGGKLSRAAIRRLDAADSVCISAVSGFEVAVKYREDKLELPVAPAQWFEQVAEHHALEVIPLDLTICIQSALLPLHHNDPCDRLIIATAKARGLTIVTLDTRFAAYGVAVLE